MWTLCQHVSLHSFLPCWPPQWQYDHTTAIYLLLLSKKQRGKPVRLRPEPSVCEDAYSPSQQGLQVRLRTTMPTMLCCLHWVLPTVYQYQMLSCIFSPCFSPFLIFSLSFSQGKLFIIARMKMLCLWVLWILAQTTLMTVPGFQANNTHPRGSEGSQTDVQATKTRCVGVGLNICFCFVSSLEKVQKKEHVWIKTFSLGASLMSLPEKYTHATFPASS